MQRVTGLAAVHLRRQSRQAASRLATGSCHGPRGRSSGTSSRQPPARYLCFSGRPPAAGWLRRARQAPVHAIRGHGGLPGSGAGRLQNLARPSGDALARHVQNLSPSPALILGSHPRRAFVQPAGAGSVGLRCRVPAIQARAMLSPPRLKCVGCRRKERESGSGANVCTSKRACPRARLQRADYLWTDSNALPKHIGRDSPATGAGGGTAGPFVADRAKNGRLRNCTCHSISVRLVTLPGWHVAVAATAIYPRQELHTATMVSATRSCNPKWPVEVGTQPLSADEPNRHEKGLTRGGNNDIVWRIRRCCIIQVAATRTNPGVRSILSNAICFLVSSHLGVTGTFFLLLLCTESFFLLVEQLRVLLCIQIKPDQPDIKQDSCVVK